MAAASPLQKLQENTTCTLCFCFFMDPTMIIGCGHNFCKACITLHWGGSLRNVSCPQCGVSFSRAKLKPNKQLKSMVEAVQELISEPTSLGNICSSHGKPLEHFCREDSTVICETCVGSNKHEGHAVLPAGEAAREEKNRIQDHLKKLKKDGDVAANYLKSAENTCRYLLAFHSGKSKWKVESPQIDWVETKRCQDYEAKPEEDCEEDYGSKIKHLREHAQEALGQERKAFIAEMEKICQSLKVQGEFLLPHLDEMETIIKKKGSEIKTNRDIAQLNSLIFTAEKLCKLSGAEFLKKIAQLNGLIPDIQKMCNKIRTEYTKEVESGFNLLGEEQFVQDTLADLDNRLQKIAELNVTVKESLNKCKDKAITALWWARKEALKPYNAENVILDRNTAHNLLTVSEDQNSVWFDMEEFEDKAYHPKRFDKRCCVLGVLGFSSGRFFWKVDVRNGKDWAIGVARESVERKCPLYFSPEEGIWAIGVVDKGYQAFTSSGNIPVSLSEPLKTIEIYLDYEAGEVSFLNDDNKSVIFTFPPAKFGGEKIYPWFSIEEGKISMCEVENESFEHYCLSTGIIKPWELHEYELPLDPRKQYQN